MYDVQQLYEHKFRKGDNLSFYSTSLIYIVNLYELFCVIDNCLKVFIYVKHTKNFGGGVNVVGCGGVGGSCGGVGGVGGVGGFYLCFRCSFPHW